MNAERDYKPFDGDGRERCSPTLVLPNTQPIAVSNSAARGTIDRFMDHGSSSHSAQGGMLWVLLVWCQQHKVAYHLQAHPDLGYFIERTQP